MTDDTPNPTAPAASKTPRSGRGSKPKGEEPMTTAQRVAAWRKRQREAGLERREMWGKKSTDE